MTSTPTDAPPRRATPARQAEAELADRLIGTAARLVRLVSASADTTLSMVQARTLARLRDAGPRRVTELARAERCSQPSMTTLLDRLQHLGLVARAPDPADRRAVLASITPAGRAEVADARAAMAAVLAPRLRELDARTQRDVAAAEKTLRRLLETFDR